MWIWLLYIILALVVAAMIWLARKPAEINVAHSKVIAASPETLYSTVRDLHSWQAWSPWLMHEPDTTLTYSNDEQQTGSWYTWDGKLTGAGKLTHTTLSTNECIDQHIEFTRPMKSQGDVYWTFRAVDNGTEVTWGMRSKMPFFFRWLVPMISEGVSKDYQIGLQKLAMHVGDNSDPLDIRFEGMIAVDEETYIARRYSGSVDDLPAAFQTAYPALSNIIEKNGMAMAGMPLALYTNFNPNTRHITCDIALPVQTVIGDGDFISGTLPARTYQRTVQHGSYDHTELAWHAAMSHVRMTKVKIAKDQPMLERYPTDPTECSGLDLVTYIDIPVR